ncbi:MAG: DUF6010 family protein [Phycisphaerales bacterium]
MALSLAGLSCLAHALLPRETSHNLFAVVLGALGGIYLGGALKGGNRFDVAVTAAGAVICVVVATAALRGPWWLTGVGFLLHAVWDWVHHAMHKNTVGRWWPPFCAIYDVVVGGFLLITHVIASAH